MLNFITTGLRHRQTVRELNRLSDRQLSDLGINRADIKLIVSVAAGSDPSSVTSYARGTMAPAWAFHNRRALAV